jgi:radical SAM protein with 4Fe4S-binding SPASM domain
MSLDTLKNILSKLQIIYNEGGYKRTKMSCTGGNPFSTDRILDYISLLNNEYHLNHLASADVCYPTNFNRLKKYIDFGGWVMLSMNEVPISEMKLIVDTVGTKPIFVFNVVLTKFNMERIKEIMDFVDEYKLPMRMDHLFDPLDAANNIPIILKTLPYIFDRLIDSKIKYKYNHILGNIYPYKKRSEDYCGYGKSAFYFDTYGNVRRCHMEDSIGHINDNDLLEKHNILKEQNRECSECSVFNYCKGGCYHTNKEKLYCVVYKEIGKFIERVKGAGLCK